VYEYKVGIAKIQASSLISMAAVKRHNAYTVYENMNYNA
jgi:hypothetical protein